MTTRRQLEKAEPKGGKYHRRVPKEDGSGHRYFYTAEAYAKLPDAHIAGADVLRDRLRKEVRDRMSTRPVPPGGWQPSHFPDLVEKHGVEGVQTAIINGLGLSKAEGGTGRTGEGSRGGIVIGHTSSGAPVYQTDARPVRRVSEGDPLWTGKRGPVMAHTSSRKPIYRISTGAAHAVHTGGYNMRDHKEAEDAHYAAAGHHSGVPPDVAAAPDTHLQAYHWAMSNHHEAMADYKDPNGETKYKHKEGRLEDAQHYAAKADWHARQILAGKTSYVAPPKPWELEPTVQDEFGNTYPNPRYKGPPLTKSEATDDAPPRDDALEWAWHRNRPELWKSTAATIPRPGALLPQDPKVAKVGSDMEKLEALRSGVEDKTPAQENKDGDTVEKCEGKAGGKCCEKCEKASTCKECTATTQPKTPLPALLEKAAGGPFIGPKGGKWADPKHTIAWKEEVPDYKMHVVGGKDQAEAKDVAGKIHAGIGQAADLCQTHPSVCKDNLGIERADMPQIPDDVQDKFMADLAHKGVKVTRTDVKPGHLKATQKEINATKVLGMAQAVKDGKLNLHDRAIVVSKDNYVLDGHHRWAALLMSDPGHTMPIIQVDMPIKDLLPASLQFPGVKSGQGFAAPSDQAKKGGLANWLAKAAYEEKDAKPGESAPDAEEAKEKKMEDKIAAETGESDEKDDDKEKGENPFDKSTNPTDPPIPADPSLPGDKALPNDKAPAQAVHAVTKPLPKKVATVQKPGRGAVAPASPGTPAVPANTQGAYNGQTSTEKSMRGLDTWLSKAFPQAAQDQAQQQRVPPPAPEGQAPAKGPPPPPAKKKPAPPQAQAHQEPDADDRGGAPDHDPDDSAAQAATGKDSRDPKGQVGPNKPFRGPPPKGNPPPPQPDQQQAPQKGPPQQLHKSAKDNTMHGLKGWMQKSGIPDAKDPSEGSVNAEITGEPPDQGLDVGDANGEQFKGTDGAHAQVRVGSPQPSVPSGETTPLASNDPKQVGEFPTGEPGELKVTTGDDEAAKVADAMGSVLAKSATADGSAGTRPQREANLRRAQQIAALRKGAPETVVGRGVAVAAAPQAARPSQAAQLLKAVLSTDDAVEELLKSGGQAPAIGLKNALMRTTTCGSCQANVPEMFKSGACPNCGEDMVKSFVLPMYRPAGALRPAPRVADMYLPNGTMQKK